MGGGRGVRREWWSWPTTAPTTPPMSPGVAARRSSRRSATARRRPERSASSARWSSTLLTMPAATLHAPFDRDALLVRGVGERGVVGLVLVGFGDGEYPQRHVARLHVY